MGDQDTSVGDAIKGVQTGQLPIGTVEEILERAPEDIVEDTLDIPEWGCSVKVKSLTGAQSALIKQKGFKSREDGVTEVQWAQMEQEQFKAVVVEPKFTDEQVLQLHLTSGRGFARIVEWADEQNKINKEQLRAPTGRVKGSDE